MWNVRENWTKFVFPFVLNFNEETIFSKLADSIATYQVTIISSHDPVLMWNEFQYYDSDLDNMAPYVKRYMHLPQNQRRFVLSDKIIRLFSNLQSSRMSDHERGFQISEVDLYLFFNGVCFLVFEIQPTGEEATPITVEWIEDLNADLGSLTRRTPIWRRQTEPITHPVSEIPTWLEQVTTEDTLVGVASGHPFTLQSLIQNVFLASIEEFLGEGAWQQMIDTFLLAYGALLFDKPDAHVSERQHSSFLDYAAKHITVLRKTLSSSNSNHFVRHILNDPEHNYVPYYNVIHTQSLEGGYVMAFDNGASHFQGKRSPAMRSFRTNYFYMMLLALHQRMSILVYAMSAADAALSADRAQKLRLLREHIYDFTSRCYFSQASVSEERDQLYRRWQRVFNVSQMYEELKEEIKEIDDYLAGIAKERELEAKEHELRHEARRTQLFSWISFIFLPVTIIIYLIQASPVISSWINFKSDPVGSALLIAVMLLIALIVARAIIRSYKKIRED